jgi:hypothetical protein
MLNDRPQCETCGGFLRSGHTARWCDPCTHKLGVEVRKKLPVSFYDRPGFRMDLLEYRFQRVFAAVLRRGDVSRLGGRATGLRAEVAGVTVLRAGTRRPTDRHRGAGEHGELDERGGWTTRRRPQALADRTGHRAPRRAPTLHRPDGRDFDEHRRAVDAPGPAPRGDRPGPLCRCHHGHEQVPGQQLHPALRSYEPCLGSGMVGHGRARSGRASSRWTRPGRSSPVSP